MHTKLQFQDMQKISNATGALTSFKISSTKEVSTIPLCPLFGHINLKDKKCLRKYQSDEYKERMEEPNIATKNNHTYAHTHMHACTHTQTQMTSD